MNNYKCYFVTKVGTERFGREILEMAVIQCDDILAASLKAHEIVHYNSERYLFVHDIVEC